jgi:hypothetical protein
MSLANEDPKIFIVKLHFLLEVTPTAVVDELASDNLPLREILDASVREALRADLAMDAAPLDEIQIHFLRHREGQPREGLRRKVGW